MRTAWIRPSTMVGNGPSCAAAGGVSPFFHERGELLRVDVARRHELQRPLGREPLSLPKRRLGRATEQAAGLAIDPHPTGLELAGIGARLRHGGHEARDERGADERLPRRHRLAAAVGVQDGVLGEQLLQGLQIAFLGGRQEPFQQGVAGSAVGVEARTAGLEMLPSSRHELPRVHLGPLDDAGDLRVVVAEHLAQQVGRPLDRGQPLQQHQQRQRQRIRELRARRRIERRVLDQRLRQPRPHIRLATDPRRPQDVDREPRHHGRHPRGRLVDRAFLARQAQERLLGHVLGLRDAAKHPVRHANAVPPERLEVPRRSPQLLSIDGSLVRAHPLLLPRNRCLTTTR
jgi:hypothetical protein